MRSASIAVFLATCASTPLFAGDPVPFTFEKAAVIGQLGRGGRTPIRFDALEYLIVRGEFASPKPGETITSTDGTVRTWEAIESKEGRFQHEALGGGYAYATFESDADTTLVLEAAGHSLVYVNGVPRTGDPYGFGFMKLPVPIQKGRNEFLFVCGRGGFSARLAPLPAAQPYFLGADDTVPNLVTGRPIDTVFATVVVNPTKDFGPGYAIEVRGMGEPQRTAIPALPPYGPWKARVELRGPAPASKGPVALELALLAPDGRTIATRPLTLQTVDPGDRRSETFTSAIDGSAQYYALVPPAAGGPEKPGLVLSLHGASVEATSQAAAYAPKDFAAIVCPTNRRPYGFDWEDWGRLDAIEVLGIAAQRLGSDPRRQWLTGHSMGGHGTWQIGVHFPDRFAAIAPSAGWISFRSYTGGAEFKSESVEGILQRAASPSETLVLKKNYAKQGVYILHGDADDNVPVQQARTMRGQLAGGEGAFHSDFVYYERPGAGHWWGNECVDWPPLIRFLAERTLPDPDAVDQIDFTTAAPWVSSTHRWIAVEQQIEAMKPSNVSLTRDKATRSYEGSTSNVALFAIRALPEGDAPINLKLDGATIQAARPASGELWLAREGDAWKVAEAPAPTAKRAARGGPFKDAFRERFLFVVGTGGDDAMDARLLDQARYAAETFWYRGNASIEIALDTAFDPAAAKDRSVILYGNAETNAAWPKLLAQCPILVRNGSVKVGDREVAGEDLACVFAYPRSDSSRAMVAAVAGTGPIGQRLTERMPFFLSGVGYPDCTVFAAETLLKGVAGVRAAGFFGNDWSVERGAWAASTGSATP